MKKVHDILQIEVDSPLEAGPRAAIPVAFIQYGTEEEGFQYEAICPWCEHSIGWIQNASTYRDLFIALSRCMAEHQRNRCASFGAHKLNVEIATSSLGTEKLPTVN